MDEDEVRKGHHCAWQIHYHVVFPVKYRRTLLDEEVVRIIVETAEGIAQRYDIEFESIGCDRDHIHSPKLLDEVRKVHRLHHYSIHT